MGKRGDGKIGEGSRFGTCLEGVVADFADAVFGLEGIVLIEVEAADEVGAVLVVGEAGLGAGGVAGGIKMEAMPVAAHVALETAGDAEDEAVVRHICGDDGACGDEGVAAEGDAADDGGIGSDGGTAADPGFLIKRTADDLGAGIGDVGEDAGGAEEDIVLDVGAAVDGDVVLDFDVLADGDAVCDHGVLAEGAVGTDFGTAADVGEVPDAGVIADDSTGIDDGGGVRLIGRHDAAAWGLGLSGSLL